MPSPTARDTLAAAALWLAVMIVFAPGASSLGFYYDDGPAMADLPSVSLPELWSRVRGYLPGRNLLVLWEYLLLRLIGDPGANLPALHLAQSALDGAVVVAFFFLLRRLSIPADAAVLAAGLFSVWPTHGETHFWPYAAPQNLVSTLFVVLFALTSLAGPRGWLWLLDTGALLAALFTYDQTFFVLSGIVLLRLWTRRRSIDLCYLAAPVLFAWLKLSGGAGRGPELRPDTLHMLRVNIPDTLSYTVGRLWFRHVAPLYDRTTAADWALALLAVGVLATAVWRLRQAPDQPLRRHALGLAVFFYLASYLPIWLWHVSERHHYLPSIGLFAGGAVCLTWLLERLRPPARTALIVLAGAATFLFAAAGRGESRWWEESFRLKKQLFAELQADLRDKQVLVLENFPLRLGPAYLITPQDAAFAPRLLAGNRTILAGDTSSSPAHDGLFLYTDPFLHGTEGFVYHPTHRSLLVRSLGIDSRRLRYEKPPPAQVPYAVTPAASAVPRGAHGYAFAASARWDGDSLLVSLSFLGDVAAHQRLVVIPSFMASNGLFHRWGQHGRFLPVLLGAAGNYDLRLQPFPRTARILLEVYSAAPGRRPVPLDRREVQVEL